MNLWETEHFSEGIADISIADFAAQQGEKKKAEDFIVSKKK